MTEVSSFWARRRAAVAAEEEADRRATQLAERETSFKDKDDSEILAELGLPDPETLQKGDDFTGFMAAAVPEHLRKVALRTLWRSNPVLACVDGLNEYDDDYRAAMLLSEPVKTAYQVGKGMKAHIDEMARKAAAAEDAEINVVDAENDAEEEAQIAALEEVSVAQSEAKAEKQEIETDVTFDAEEAIDLPTRQRMRFRFEEAQA